MRLATTTSNSAFIFVPADALVFSVAEVQFGPFLESHLTPLMRDSFMGLIDLNRVAYPPPDEKKISQKIMDWLENNESLVMQSAANSQLADDYMVGWTCDEFHRKYLGMMAVMGQYDPHTFRYFKQLSMMRGVEVWDMIISCATSLKANHADPKSLDGQDLLTYLTKIVANSSGGIPNHDGQERLPPNQLKANGRKGKRKRHNESHFFEKGAPDENTDVPSKKAKKAAKRAEKKKNRRAKRALIKSQNGEPLLHGPSNPTPAVPVLREAAVWYRSNDNVSAPNDATVTHAQASIHDGTVEGSEKDLSGESRQEQAEYQPQKSPSTLESLGAEMLDKASVAGSTALEAENSLIIRTEGGRYALRSASQTPRQIPASERQALEEGLATSEPAKETKRTLRSASQSVKKERAATSKYFVTPNPSPIKPKSPRPARGTVSALPFPTLFAPRFGLVQEKLADDPFRLMIAISFLVRTPGRISVPVFYELMEKYPTPQALMEADSGEIVAMIKQLGLSVVRTSQIQKYARIWIENPPSSTVRYGVKNYPKPGDGSDVRAGEKLPSEDQDSRASAWEIGHMTQGPYAIDSWRIFCRDVLLGRAQDWMGKGREPEFQPEWMRVAPLDKELRAYLRWMWMKEDWDWNPKTGERVPLGEELRKAVNDGRVQWDNTGELQIVDTASGHEDDLKDEVDG
ncbi:Methyl-CpG-binding domain protein 4 [Seiridium cupressi]